jgi:hypothetical protein
LAMLVLLAAMGAAPQAWPSALAAAAACGLCGLCSVRANARANPRPPKTIPSAATGRAA